MIFPFVYLIFLLIVSFNPSFSAEAPKHDASPKHDSTRHEQKHKPGLPQGCLQDSDCPQCEWCNVFGLCDSTCRCKELERDCCTSAFVCTEDCHCKKGERCRRGVCVCGCDKSANQGIDCANALICADDCDCKKGEWCTNTVCGQRCRCDINGKQQEIIAGTKCKEHWNCSHDCDCLPGHECTRGKHEEWKSCKPKALTPIKPEKKKGLTPIKPEKKKK